MVHAELCLECSLQVWRMTGRPPTQDREPGAHPEVTTTLCWSPWPQPLEETLLGGRTPRADPQAPGSQGRTRSQPPRGAVPSASPVCSVTPVVASHWGSSSGHSRLRLHPRPPPGLQDCPLPRDRPTAPRPPPPAEGPGLRAPTGSTLEASSAPPWPPRSLSLGPCSAYEGGQPPGR